MALHVSLGDPIFIGDFFGLVLALPLSLFLAFWLSAVKKRAAVLFGALFGTLIGFIILLSFAGTLVFSTAPIAGANGGSVFFGSVLFCSILGLMGGIFTDILVARKNSRDYRQQISHE
jgi:hypothetical protein